MNPSTAIFLVSDKVRAIRVTYTNPEDAKRAQESMGYTFKTLNPDIKVGDIVVVPTHTRHGYTCCKVVEADVVFDDNSNIEYKWIVDVVNLADYDKVLAMEAKVIEKVKLAEVARKRKQLAMDLEGLDQVNIDTLLLTADPAPVASNPPKQG